MSFYRIKGCFFLQFFVSLFIEMRLSNNLSQNFSLQLATSLALEQGVEQMHEMVKAHQDNLTHSGFIGEAKNHFLRANKKGFFDKNLPDSHFLKNDKNLLERTISYAARRHRGEYRESGFPYLAHVLSTGFILARLGFPREIILSGILHDTVEDAPDKTKTLNELYALMPSIAYYVYSVSGPDIKDSVEKDKQLHNRLHAFSDNAQSLFPQAIKVADGLANLYDITSMQPKDGRTSAERQALFMAKMKTLLLPYATAIDEKNLIPVKKKKEVFSLFEFLKDSIEEKNLHP